MRRPSIRFRLLILVTFIAILPVVTTTWVATRNTRDSVEKEVINANFDRMRWADQYVRELIEQISSLFYTLQIDQGLMEALHEVDDPSLVVQRKAHNYIQDTLNTAFYAYSRKIDELTLYSHLNSRAVSVSYANSGRVSRADITNSDWSRIDDGPINMYFKESTDGVYVYHSINRFGDQELIGGISGRISRQVWKELGEILNSEPEGIVMILNDEGDLLSGSARQGQDPALQEPLTGLTGSIYETSFFTTDEHYYWVRPTADYRLTIAKVLPRQVIQSSAEPTIRAGLIASGLIAVFCVLLAVMVSYRFSYPILRLAKKVRAPGISNMGSGVAEDLDELQTLEQSYDAIVNQIKGLLEDEYNRELELKDAQLRALQAQINPHFLNNTLSLMGGLALSHNAPEIYKITRIVGELLRYAISQDGDMVTLHDELGHTRNYVYIQEQRFASKCQVTVSVDESLGSFSIPRFTLQPIVENSFEYGLQGKEGPWVVIIRVRKVGTRLVISVKDNGVGFSRERLAQVRAKLRGRGVQIKDKKQSRPGIGLSNVNSRLKLHFGPGYGIRLFSKAGAGTVVTMVLPLGQEVDANDIQSSYC